jgi:hypothetical protein
MVQAEMTGNPAQVHPIHIQSDRFPAYLVGIGPGFGFRGVFDLTKHAAITLAATVCFSSSILAFRSVTFWTFNHASILAQFLATPRLHQTFDWYPLSLRLLLTTKMLLKAIAPAASIGLSKPAAAAGINITL